jgi:3-hydroxy-9,10-secoandrosta-1,3,5(10)-triene-9,17-dione monooxygenase
MLQPARWGGLELDPGVFFDVQATIAHACPSSAWVLGVVAVHAWQLALFPEQAQVDVWGKDASTLISSSYAPTGKVERAPGGFRISGRWSFSSGCDHCQWAFLGGMIPPEGETRGPEMRTFLVPRSDYRIDDNWHTAALKGTGSKDIVIDDAFVPAHRVLEFAVAVEGNTDGWKLHHRPSYRVPLFTALSWAIAAPHIGIAQGAIDEFTTQVVGRTGPAGRSQAESPASQLRLAESAIEVDLARMLMRQDTREVIDRGERGEPFSLLDRARLRRDEAFVARLCVRATDRVFEAAGGHALYSDNALQRYQRDVHAAAHHVSMRWDTSGELYGLLALGLDPPPGARF